MSDVEEMSTDNSVLASSEYFGGMSFVRHDEGFDLGRRGLCPLGDDDPVLPVSNRASGGRSDDEPSGLIGHADDRFGVGFLRKEGQPGFGQRLAVQRDGAGEALRSAAPGQRRPSGRAGRVSAVGSWPLLSPVKVR